MTEEELNGRAAAANLHPLLVAVHCSQDCCRHGVYLRGASSSHDRGLRD